MTQSFPSLAALQDQVARDLSLGTPNELHPAFCGSPAGRSEQRRCVDMIVEQGVSYLDAKKPGRTSRDEERFLRKVRRRFKKIAREKEVDKTGFAPLVIIGGAMLNWLIGQALTWLLNWWRGSPTAADSLATICAGMPGSGWQDDVFDKEDE